MKKWLPVLLSVCLFLQGKAQKESTNSTGSKGFSIGANVLLPIGDFSSTHIAGLGIDASPSRGNMELLKQKKISFTYNAGVAYYLGKKETVSAYQYKYPGYFFIHALGGLAYVPVKNWSVKLMTGPALGIYNGATRFNIGGKLEAEYALNNRVAIGPCIMIMKEPGTNTLWAVGFRTAWTSK